MTEVAEVYNWRSRSPSDRQIELLSRGSVLMEPGLTRGEASEIIEELITSGALITGLSLAELQSCDVQGGRGPGVEKRYCCPFDGKEVADDHRDLSANMQTGAWFCHCCHRGGVLREYRTGKRLTRAELSQARARQVFSLSKPKPKAEPTPAEIEKENRWRGWWDASFPLLGTPGADYLAGRSISPELAAECGARFSGEWYGRPAVLFPVLDRAGELVAVSGRFTDGRLPKTQAGGTISAGVFSTPGALDARCVAVVEGPIDALALWTCGVAAVAIIGVSWTEWLPRALAFKSVLIATDNDQGGEDCAIKLDPVMIARGARVLRLKPRCKDWAKVLEEIGADRLRPHLRGFAISPRLAFDDQDLTDDDVRICAARDLADAGRLPEAHFIIRLLDDLGAAEAIRAKLMD
jgi:hypothetical protein